MASALANAAPVVAEALRPDTINAWHPTEVCAKNNTAFRWRTA
jgi:hypothetical protein